MVWVIVIESNSGERKLIRAASLAGALREASPVGVVRARAHRFCSWIWVERAVKQFELGGGRECEGMMQAVSAWGLEVTAWLGKEFVVAAPTLQVRVGSSRSTLESIRMPPPANA